MASTTTQTSEVDARPHLEQRITEATAQANELLVNNDYVPILDQDALREQLIILENATTDTQRKAAVSELEETIEWAHYHVEAMYDGDNMDDGYY